MADLTLGLSAGHPGDYPALAVVERVEHIDDEGLFEEDWHGQSWQVFVDHHHVRHLHRWPRRTGLREVLADVGRTLRPVTGEWEGARLTYDASGLGAALDAMVVDAWRADRLGESWPRGVVIVAGDEGEAGDLPRADLVSTMRRLLAEDRLHVPAEMAHADALRNALATFGTGRADDEMATALALAVSVRPGGMARVRLPDGYVGEQSYQTDARGRHRIRRLGPPLGTATSAAPTTAAH